MEDKGIPNSRNTAKVSSGGVTLQTGKLSLWKDHPLKCVFAEQVQLSFCHILWCLCCALVSLDKPQPRQGQVSMEVSWSSFLPGHPCSGYRASREFTCVGSTVPVALWDHISSPPARGWRAGGRSRESINLMAHLGISKFLPLQDAGLRTSMGLTHTT